MQLIISQVVYVQDSQAGIQCCLSADVLSAIEYPHLQGAAVPRLSSPARQLWELLLLIYNFGLMLFLEGLGKCLSCSTIPAWAVAGSSTLSHSRRSESLLGNGSKIPACATQELGDCFSFLSFPFFIFFFSFWQPSAVPSFLGLGGMRLLIPKVARREESQQLGPLPACKGGGAGRVAGQVGAGGTWCLLALYTTGRKSAQHSCLLILMWCEWPNDRKGTNGTFGILAKCSATCQPCPPCTPRARERWSACPVPIPQQFWL